jgi:hypothetical protein
VTSDKPLLVHICNLRRYTADVDNRRKYDAARHGGWGGMGGGWQQQRSGGGGGGGGRGGGGGGGNQWERDQEAGAYTRPLYKP